MLGNGRYVGPVLLAGLLTGIAVGDTAVEQVSTRAFEATAVGAGAALILKSAIGRRRPDVAPNTPFFFRPFAFKGNSLPSGHTTIAFALATSLASETKDHSHLPASSPRPLVRLFVLAAAPSCARDRRSSSFSDHGLTATLQRR